eukprot:2357633-Pyramimonas_sp.AAC.1
MEGGSVPATPRAPAPRSTASSAGGYAASAVPSTSAASVLAAVDKHIVMAGGSVDSGLVFSSQHSSNGNFQCEKCKLEWPM